MRMKRRTGVTGWGLYMVMAAILLLLAKTPVYAADTDVVPISAVLYTGSGAEIFALPDAATYVTSFPGDVPLQVTGQTVNGFFQVLIDNQVYYIYSNAMSTVTGTTAYKLTSVDAKAALAGDAVTGELLYAQNAFDRLAPASTTKLMTALLVMDAVSQGQLSLDTPVIVSATALAGVPYDASHVSPRLKAGEIMNILELLECTLIKSDCHACNVLAEAVAGSVDNFVALMNIRAAGLGCVDTNFVNTSGYPANNHYSNAYSLFLIAREAMKYDAIRTIAAMPQVTIAATNLTAERTFESTNELIKQSAYYNPYVIGGKTGSSSSSGLCLVTAAVKNDKYVITVILGAKSTLMSNGQVQRQQFSETNKLLDIAFQAS